MIRDLTPAERKKKMKRYRRKARLTDGLAIALFVGYALFVLFWGALCVTLVIEGILWLRRN